MRRKKVIIIKIDGTNIQEEIEDKKKKKKEQHFWEAEAFSNDQTLNFTIRFGSTLQFQG